jgi:hypothetical protein
LSLSEISVILLHGEVDNQGAQDLHRKLATDGFRCWVEKSLMVGLNRELAVRDAIAAADAVIACLSANMLAEEGVVHDRLRTAIEIAKKKPSGQIFLIPARLTPCDLPPGIDHLVSADLYEIDGYERLLLPLQKFTTS